MIVWWCHRVHNLYFVGLEDRSDLVFYAGPVCPLAVRHLRFASEYVHNVESQGGLPIYCILGTRMLVGIHERFLSKHCRLSFPHHG
jgi:hypothetical protein